MDDPESQSREVKHECPSDGIESIHSSEGKSDQRARTTQLNNDSSLKPQGQNAESSLPKYFLTYVVESTNDADNNTSSTSCSQDQPNLQEILESHQVSSNGDMPNCDAQPSTTSSLVHSIVKCKTSNTRGKEQRLNSETAVTQVIFSSGGIGQLPSDIKREPDCLESGRNDCGNLTFLSDNQTESFQSTKGKAKPSKNSFSNQRSVSPLSNSDGTDKQNNMIQKTIVETFVKMIVCRKVTVQTVNRKTNEILNEEAKIEEDDPVMLGVDSMDTTENIQSSSTTCQNIKCDEHNIDTTFRSSTTNRSPSFLGTLSRQQKTTGESVKQSTLKSALQKDGSRAIELLLELKKTARENSSAKSAVNVSYGEMCKEDSESFSEGKDDQSNNSSGDILMDNLIEMVETTQTDLSLEKKNRKPIVMERDSAGKSGDENEDQECFVPKKRGRKRKWFNTLGLASNTRSCQFCNKHFSSMSKCLSHMKKGNCISTLYCFICSTNFENEQELEQHILTHGIEGKTDYFDCSDCHRTYRTKAGYIKHFRMGTCKKKNDFEDGKTGNFACEICDIYFSSEEYLKLHQYKVHENPKDQHACPDCKKTFYSLQGFKKHRLGRQCTDPFKCHICGKIYKSKESFKLHMRHHKSEITGVTFDCDECSRTYMTQMALTKHKLSHNGVKPYKCETCGKEFAMRYQVKDHARMHTGERPFLCSLCGSSFSNKGHLGRHLRSHENGTLLRRGRPKKAREQHDNVGEETSFKMIGMGQALDSQAIQVVDGQMFDASSSGSPMIIQADNNTIIITEGWPNNTVSSTHTDPNLSNINGLVSVAANITAGDS